MNAVSEFTCARGKELFGAIHVEWQADDEQIRLPLLEQFLYLVPVGNAVVGLEGTKRAGAARVLLADGDTYALGALIKAHDAA